MSQPPLPPSPHLSLPPPLHTPFPAEADPNAPTLSTTSSTSDAGIPIAPGPGPAPPGALPPPAPGAAELDLERRNSLDFMANTRLGQGAKFFRADDLRDDHGRLLPAPGIVLAPGGPSPAGGLAGGVGGGGRWEVAPSSLQGGGTHGHGFLRPTRGWGRGPRFLGRMTLRDEYGRRGSCWRLGDPLR